MKRNHPPKRRDRKSGESPYQRHQKQPYQYSFKDCKHKTRVYQEAQNWYGTVCSSCGIIIENFSERDKRQARSLGLVAA